MTEFRKFLRALLLRFACFLLVVPATMISLALGLIFGVLAAFGAWMDRKKPRE